MDWAVLVFAPLDGRSVPDDMNDCEGVLKIVEQTIFPQVFHPRTDDQGAVKTYALCQQPWRTSAQT